MFAIVIVQLRLGQDRTAYIHTAAVETVLNDVRCCNQKDANCHDCQIVNDISGVCT